jgi:hypothetical protein
VKWFSDPSIVSKTPLVTTALLEGANVQQLWRMWHEQTAAGQSMTAWMSVGTALLLWCNYYRVILPKEKFALYCTMFGVFMNALVILTVCYFRYWSH